MVKELSTGALSSLARVMWTAIAAVAVALITWFATDRRQSAALDAEQRRLEGRLAHERELDDRQHLRDFLDEVAGSYNSVVSDYLWWRVQMSDGTDSRDHEAVLKHWNGVIDGFTTMTTNVRRLALRFSPDTPVFKAWHEVCDLLGEDMHTWVDHHAVVPFPSEDDGDARVEALNAAFRAFAREARATLESPGGSVMEPAGSSTSDG